MLRIPGTTAVFPLADEKLYLLGFKCTADCSLLNTEINEIKKSYNSPVIHIIRENKSFFAKPNESVHLNDEIFILVEKDKTFYINIELPGGGEIEPNVTVQGNSYYFIFEGRNILLDFDL